MPDFGRAELLEPEAIGEPGHRTFRLRVRSSGETASLWLEKEQLAALTLAIRQLLEQTADADPSPEPDPPPPIDTFPEPAQVDFTIGRLGIGYDEGRRMVVIFAYAQDEADEKAENEAEDEKADGAKDGAEDEPPAFACQVSRGQCRTFAERAEEVISAGRPVCLLCGGPIERGSHKCLRRNGHGSRPVPTE